MIMSDFFIVVIFIFAFLLIVLLALYIRLKPNRAEKVSREKIKKVWGRINYNINQNDFLYWKDAVVEADKLLDLVLMGVVSGKSLGERLKNANNIVRDKSLYNRIWEAHKLRNKLVHEMDYYPEYKEIVAAIENYRIFLEYFGYNIR